ncbi:hypothetical protein WISP_112867 [Willisornis vidua]|uniref:Platelet-derived growth factor (PDGF) family profile domain-containing protein n=1 Tax=Willisornis vidua TaxID=1566151 RepID=A0ABQ9D0W6_9PASS|nr:hypothetical protein WISP_112867 [Willisornis vidua]
MHLLEVLSLGCCLAAGAVLLGPREPAAVAAYESGQGYYEEEPEAGEAKMAVIPYKYLETAIFSGGNECHDKKLLVSKITFSIINRLKNFGGCTHSSNHPELKISSDIHVIEKVWQFYKIKAHASKDLEEQLRSVSSVDELMTVLYPEYWKMFKCQLRKGSWQQHNREHASFDTRSDDSLKFAAAHYNAEILKSIDTEWRKTQCMPREVCVDVGKEFGATTNTFFKPPCVSIYRCGGCCNSEGLQCMNISTNYISKTLFEITVPLSHGPKPVTVSFANHTSCRCMSKLDVYRQVHSIIRRSLPAAQTHRIRRQAKGNVPSVMWQTRPVQKIIFGIIKFADVCRSMILVSLLTLAILVVLTSLITEGGKNYIYSGIFYLKTPYVYQFVKIVMVEFVVKSVILRKLIKSRETCKEQSIPTSGSKKEVPAQWKFIYDMFEVY